MVILYRYFKNVSNITENSYQHSDINKEKIEKLCRPRSGREFFTDFSFPHYYDNSTGANESY